MFSAVLPTTDIRQCNLADCKPRGPIDQSKWPLTYPNLTKIDRAQSPDRSRMFYTCRRAEKSAAFFKQLANRHDVHVREIISIDRVVLAEL
jgi:hypothetical protein